MQKGATKLAEDRELLTQNTMKWFNLKNNKCPKCDKDFVKGLVTVGGMLIHEPCQFRIRELRYRQIVASQITADLEEKLNIENEEQL